MLADLRSLFPHIPTRVLPLRWSARHSPRRLSSTVFLFFLLAATRAPHAGATSRSTSSAEPVPAVDVVLWPGPDGLAIVASRERIGFHRGLELPSVPAIPGAVWLEVRDETGVPIHAVHLGNPAFLAYDDFSSAGDHEPRVGVAPRGNQPLFVPVPLPASAREVLLRTDRGKILDSATPAELQALANLRPLIQPGQPTATLELVRQTGPSDNRLDLLFLAEGYRREELDKFRSDVERCVDALLTEEPFKTYGDYLNVWQLPLRSAESGADKPCVGIQRKTALDASYDSPECLTRMMTYNYLDAWLTASRALPAWDHVIVLVNDPQYAGAMPPWAPGPVYSTSKYTYLTIHEWVGHDLAKLMDEYDAGEDVGPFGLPYSENCAISQWSPPWKHWINAGEPGMGAFQNCAFNNLFRPANRDCIMRVTSHARFDAFCLERAVKGLYKVVRLVESATPDPNVGVLLKERETAELEVRSPRAAHDHHYEWWLDGTLVQAGGLPWLEVEGANLTPGPHEVTVEVTDPTSMVLKDKQGLLHDRVAWRIGRY